MKKGMLIALCAIVLGVSTGASPTHAASSTYYNCAASGPGFSGGGYKLTKEAADAFKQYYIAAGATVVKCNKY